MRIRDRKLRACVSVLHHSTVTMLARVAFGRLGSNRAAERSQFRRENGLADFFDRRIRRIDSAHDMTNAKPSLVLEEREKIVAR